MFVVSLLLLRCDSQKLRYQQTPSSLSNMLDTNTSWQKDIQSHYFANLIHVCKQSRSTFDMTGAAIQSMFAICFIYL